MRKGWCWPDRLGIISCQDCNLSFGDSIPLMLPKYRRIWRCLIWTLTYRNSSLGIQVRLKGFGIYIQIALKVLKTVSPMAFRYCSCSWHANTPCRAGAALSGPTDDGSWEKHIPGQKITTKFEGFLKSQSVTSTLVEAGYFEVGKQKNVSELPALANTYLSEGNDAFLL